MVVMVVMVGKFENEKKRMRGLVESITRMAAVLGYIELMASMQRRVVCFEALSAGGRCAKCDVTCGYSHFNVIYWHSNIDAIQLIR